MNIKTKKEWLMAYKTTLYQYENETHVGSAEKCHKCILVRDNKLQPQYNCEICLERKHVNTPYLLPCLYRNNQAMDSDNMESVEVAAGIIEYHKQAIELLESISGWNEYLFGYVQSMLVKIDRRIQ